MNILKHLRKPFNYTIWNAAFTLIGINGLVYLLTSVDPTLVRLLSLNPLFVVKQKMYWQVFTYQFVHGNFAHLLSNMFGLLFFGYAIERKMGSKEFLLFYLVSGALSGFISLLVYIFTSTYYIFLMGASGAIFAVLFAYAVLYPNSTIYLWMVFPIPAPLLVLGYAAVEIFSLFTSPGSGIAHGTHLSGFAVAWIYFLIRFGINPIRIWRR